MDHAVADHVAVLGEEEGHAHVLLHEQDRNAFIAVDAVDDAEDVEHDARGEGGARLVEHDELGVGHQATPDDEHLHLAPAQGCGKLAAALAEHREIVEHLLHVGRDPRLVAAGIGADPEVLLHRHGRVHVLALGDLGEPAPDDDVGLAVPDLLAVELDGPGPHWQEAGDRLQQRRLAGTVTAEESDDTAFGHGHVDAAQDLYLAVSGLEVANFEHGGSFSRTASRADPFPHTGSEEQRASLGPGGRPILPSKAVEQWRYRLIRTPRAISRRCSSIR